jgi:hypothetical protein
MYAINCRVYLEGGGEPLLFIPTCFRILVVNIQQPVSALPRTIGAALLPRLKKRNPLFW